MSLIVKICGLSTPETLDAALDAGADMVGFMFFPRSPRFVDLKTAAALAQRARGRAEIAVVTVDMEDRQMREIVETIKPDWLQLHGTESSDSVEATKLAFGTKVMKVLPIAVRGDLDRVPRYAAVADRIMFDAKAPKDATRPGGLGVPFDWHLLENLKLPVPFMVSGGLNVENVAEALRITRAPCVDVSSGVESAPGVKDLAKIRSFIAAARAAADASAPAKLARSGA